MKRRTILTGLAALVPASVATRLQAQDHDCQLLTPDLRGPFDIPQYLERSDLRDGQPGVPLTLDLTVLNVMDCAPLAGAAVTLWHSNPQGLYSAVENVMLDARMNRTGKVVDQRAFTYCRGIQRTDAEGKVRFVTNFPGWYYPRPPHIHVKITPRDVGEEAVSQFYLRNEICDEVYKTEHYAQRGPAPIRAEPGQPNPIFATEAEDLWLDLQADGDGYRASNVVAIAEFGDRFGELDDMYRHS